MNVVYPAIFRFEDGGYWCEFPDLDGCFSQGDAELEVVKNAKEALEGYVASILERGGSLPEPSAIKNVSLAGGDFIAYILCDVSSGGKFVSKSVTLPEWLSVRAEQASINFSQTLQEALSQKLGIPVKADATV